MITDVKFIGNEEENNPTQQKHMLEDNFSQSDAQTPDNLDYEPMQKHNWLSNTYHNVKKFFGVDKDRYKIFKDYAKENKMDVVDVYKKFNVLGEHEWEAIANNFLPDFMAYSMHPETTTGAVGSAVTSIAGFLIPIGGEAKALGLAGKGIEAYEGGAKSINLAKNVLEFFGKHEVAKSIMANASIGFASTVTGAYDQTNDLSKSIEEGLKQGTVWGLAGVASPFANIVKSRFGRAAFSIAALQTAEGVVNNVTGSNEHNDIVNIFTSQDPKLIATSLFNVGLVGAFGGLSKVEPREGGDIIDAVNNAKPKEKAEFFDDVKKYEKSVEEGTPLVDNEIVDKHINAFSAETDKLANNEPNEITAGIDEVKNISTEHNANVDEIAKNIEQSKAVNNVADAVINPSKAVENAEPTKPNINDLILEDLNNHQPEKVAGDMDLSDVDTSDPYYMLGGLPLEEFKRQYEKSTVKTGEGEVGWWANLMTPFHLARLKGVTGETFKRLLKVYDKSKVLVESFSNDLTNKHRNKIAEAVKNKNVKAVYNKYKTIGDALQISPVKAFREGRDFDGIGDKYQRHMLEDKFKDAKKYDELTDTEKQQVEMALKHDKTIHDTVRKVMNRVVEKHINNMQASAKLKGEMLKAYYDVVKKYPEYMHRGRNFGNIKLTVRNPDGQVIHTEFINSVLAQLTKHGRAKLSLSKQYGALKKYFPESEGYYIHADKYSSENVPKGDAIEIMQWLLDNTVDTGLSQAQVDAVIQKGLDSLKAQGAMASTIKRSERYITGFDTDALNNIDVYMGKTAGFLLKQNIKDEVPKIALQIPKNNPRLRKIFDNTVTEMLRSKTFADQWIGKTRGLMFLGYLGGHLRAPLVNLTQTPIWTTSMLSNEVGVAKAHALTIQASADVLAKHYMPEEKVMLDKARKQGILEAQRTEFISGRSEMVRNELENKLAYFFRESENFNRTTAALAYMRAVKDRGYSEEAMLTGMREFVELSQGRYGDTNLPTMLLGDSGLKKVLRTGYTFQAYNVHMIQNVIEMFGKGEIKPLLNLMAMSVMFGGLTGLPFAQSIIYVARHFFGLDPADEIKKYLHWQTPIGNTLVDGGILGFVGINISNNIAITTPLANAQYSDNLADSIMNSVAGVYWATLKNSIKGVDCLMKGEYEKAFEYGVPAKFLTYPLKALREYKVGFTTSSGLKVIDPATGKQLKLTEGEAVLQAVGITPERIAEMQQEMLAYRSISTYFLNRRKMLYEKYRMAETYDERNKILKQMNELNKRIQAQNLQHIIPLAKAPSDRNSSFVSGWVRYYADQVNDSK